MPRRPSGSISRWMSWLGSHMRTGGTGMSVRVMAEVFRSSRASLGARLVLLALADDVDEEHRECWPSLQTIAAKAHISVRGVQYAVEKLQALGELTVTGRSGHSNIWRIPPVDEWGTKPASGVAESAP